MSWRFGVFTYAPTKGELRKGDTVLRLQDQPRRILEILLERPGEVVTRQELQEALWPAGINVDFEASLNAAVRRLRQVLIDDADRPRYIETLPRKGYRFIAPVERISRATGVTEAYAEPVAPAPDRVASARPPRRRLRAWAAVGGLAVLAIAVAAMFRASRDGAAIRVAEASILIPPDLTIDSASGRTVAISEDGQIVAYSASGNGGRYLYVRPLSQAKTELVPGSEGALTPVFLPGHTLAWTTPRGLYKSAGGRARLLVPWPQAPPGSMVNATSGGDLLFSRMEPLAATATAGIAASPWILRQGSTTPERLETQYSGPGIDVEFPQQMIDGRYLLFSTNEGPFDRSVVILDRESRQQRVLAKPAMGGRLLSNGKLLYFWDGELLQAPFHRETLTLAAPGVPVLSGVSAAGWTGPNADVSSNGTLVYVPAAPRPDVRLVWVDLQGRTSPVPVPAGPLRVADLSSDGKHLLLVRETGPDLGKLLDYNLSTGSSRELVADADPRACWSADRKYVVYSKTEPGESLPTLHLLDVETNRSERWLPFQGMGQFGVQWVVASGRLIFVTGYHPKTQIDIWSVSTRDRPPTAAPVVLERGSQTQPRVSPDGKWIAYVDELAGGSIVIRATGGGPAEMARAPGEGSAPLWSGDGRWLYYRSGVRFLAASFRPGNPPSLGTPRVLFEGDYMRPTKWFASTFFDQATRRFLVAIPERKAAVPAHIEVITNWVQETTSR